jgi:hypothetical protein
MTDNIIAALENARPVAHGRVASDLANRDEEPLE